MYGVLRGSDARLRGTNAAMMTRPAMRPLKMLAVVGTALLMWGLLFAYASSPAQAATLTVDSLTDGAPANDGQCTLREAISNANANDQSGSTDCAAGSGNDAIRVGVSGTVQLSGALPNLASDMSIEGPGADQLTVRRDTGGDYRIFTITSDGTEPVVSISGITISNGNASQTLGGGILNFGTLTLTGSTISGNSAIRGGGISNHETLTVIRSTISGNSATLGGGIYSDTGNLYNLSKRTTVTNSTISGNSSTRGGGVLTWDGLTVIEHSTITKNTAPSDGGSGVASSADVNTRTEVLSTIISENTNTDVDFLGVVGLTPNTFVSKGYNLIGSGKAIGAFKQDGDQTDVGDPKLGALADNGGPTQTHALLPASPARDAIPQGTNGCGTSFTEDQRGVARPQASACDIGSFELATITVKSLEDTLADDGQCTLREAITSANDNNTVSGDTPGECAVGSGAGSDIIEVGTTGMVQLTGPLPNLASNMQIEGPGADQFTVRRDTGGDYRIFTVTSGSVVSISGITISGGNVPGNTSSSNGGGIYNDGGTLAIASSAISGNSTGSNGGGVANRRGTLTINGSTISDNRAGNEGGGVYSLASLSGPTTTVTNSTISGNSATSRGGGVFNGDGLTAIENSTITKNTAPSDGGSGVASFGGDRNSTGVLSSIISENTNTDVDFTTSSTNTFDSKGYNLIGSGNAISAFDQGSDQTKVNEPRLGALADNGGHTNTHALLAGSPAIDKGKSSDPATDQRGKKRPFDDPSIDPAEGGDDSDIGSFEVQGVLDSAPQAADDAYKVNEDTALTVAAPGVLTNDTSLGSTLTAVQVSGPGHADSFDLNADGSFSYTPKKDYNGPDSFTYKATGGSADSNVATVNISVGPVNDDPTAEDDAITTAEDTAKKVDVLSLLSNDSDVDGDAIGITGVGTPSHGTATLNDNATPTNFDDDSIDYAPASNYNGSDSFTYTVSDGKGGTATATVNVTVTPVSHAPAAKDDSATTNEDTAITIPVLSNDSAVDGGSLRVGNFTNGTHGTVSRSTDGTKLTYKPNADYSGPDSFTYRATDGTQDSNTATVSIQVNPLDDAPKIAVVAGSGSQSACLGDTTGRITLKLSDVDTNLGDLKTSVASSSDTRLVPKSNVAFGGTGGTRTATITTVAGRTGTSTVRITVSDGQASSTVPVTVKAGGKARDTLGGTSGADLLLGQNGNDTLGGAGASDVLCGAGGNDKLSGGTGSDTFDGGTGTDAATDYNAAAGDSRTNIP